MKFSIVSPVYKAAEILPVLVNRINSSMGSITKSYEVILVDDGCPSDSWAVIESLANEFPNIIGLKLSRNFGQHYAITAGLENARGEWIVVMDCDLQDQPEEIEKLYLKACEGFDIVLACRNQRLDSFIKVKLSLLFYRILGYLTGSEQDPTIANFGIYNRKVINAIVSLRESIRYFPTMVKWVGFCKAKIDVEHAQRHSGQTSYNFIKLFRLGLDIILAYSDKPIRLVVKLGILISCMSLIIAAKTFIDYVQGEIIVLGYASLLISIWLLSGIIISILGVVGLYVGKTFEGVKNRPLYIIEKQVGNN